MMKQGSRVDHIHSDNRSECLKVTVPGYHINPPHSCTVPFELVHRQFVP